MTDNDTRFKKICADIDAMSEEYIRENGFVTCEMAISEDMVEPVRQYVESIKSKFVGEVEGASWYITHCTTCEEYHVDRPYHVALLDKDAK